MPRELSPSQKQRLSALVEQEGMAFANEANALGLSSLPISRDGYQIEINLGHICNDICSFCVSGLLTQEGLAKALPAEPIIAALKSARQRGVTELTLLGGEPTIQKNFFPVLEAAFELGFESVTVFTNLARGKDPKFFERVLRTGRVKWRVSIQGGDASTHDHVVQRTGAFARISEGLEWLLLNGQDVTINTCVTTESASSLQGFLGILNAFPVRHLHIDMFRPSSTGRDEDEYALELIPDYADVGRRLNTLLTALSAVPGHPTVSVGGLPFCFLPEWSHLVHHGGEQTVMISVADGDQESSFWDKYSTQDAGRFQTEPCNECLFKSSCHGLPIGYGMKFESVVLQPITPSVALGLSGAVRQLWERGFQRDNQVVERDWSAWPEQMQKVGRRFASLRAASPFDGWAFESDLVVLSAGRAYMRFQKGVRRFDLRVNVAEKLRIDFDVQGDVTPMKRAIEQISQVLRYGVRQH